MSKFFNKGVIIVLSIIGLSAIGAGGWFFWQSSGPTEQIIRKLADNFMQIKSFEYSGSLNITTNERQAENGLDGKQPLINYKLPGDISINFNGASQMAESEDKGMVSFLALSLKDLKDKENNISVDMKTIDKVFYLALQDQSQINKFDLTPFKGFWIKVDPQALMDKFGKQYGLDKLDKKDEPAQKSEEELNAMQKIEDLKKLALNKTFFKITKKLPPETLNGVETKHYQVSFDKEETIEFIAEGIRMMNTDIDSPKTLEKEISEMKEKILSQELLPGEIWIGQKDHLPYRIMYTLRTQANQPSRRSIDYSFLLNFLNYNQPVVVEAPKPEEVRTVEEMMASFLKKPEFSQEIINQSSPPLPVSVSDEPLFDKVEPIQ